MKFGGKWKEKIGGMTENISFWRGKDNYLFYGCPLNFSLIRKA